MRMLIMTLIGSYIFAFELQSQQLLRANVGVPSVFHVSRFEGINICTEIAYEKNISNKYLFLNYLFSNNNIKPSSNLFTFDYKSHNLNIGLGYLFWNLNKLEADVFTNLGWMFSSFQLNEFSESAIYKSVPCGGGGIGLRYYLNEKMMINARFSVVGLFDKFEYEPKYSYTTNYILDYPKTVFQNNLSIGCSYKLK